MSLADLAVGLTLDAGKFVVAVVQSEVAALGAVAPRPGRSVERAPRPPTMALPTGAWVARDVAAKGTAVPCAADVGAVAARSSAT